MKVIVNPIRKKSIEVQEKYDGLWTIVCIAVSSIFTTELIQYLLLSEELRQELRNEKLFLNICCALIVYLMLQACINHVAVSCISAHVLLVGFGIINHFVYEFRGNELTFGDIKSIGTGISVASNYKFTWNIQLVTAISLTIIYAFLISRMHITFKRSFIMRVLCLSLALLSFTCVSARTENMVTETWEQKGTYRNGFLLNFALSIRDSFVDKPEYYSIESVNRIADKYTEEHTEDTSAGMKKKPTVIAIMDESFADFDVLGNLQTNKEVTPFIDSLSENTVRGYALASVFGAKTPNSEWEFLTGNSTAWLPEGSVAYQQYFDEENAYSLVGALKKEEYTCVAMHPYYETGWSRNTVYPKMGFDEMYFLEDFDQSHLIREYVPDTVMFDRIIERYEAGKGQENLFLMGITMQNHGGYKERYENFPIDVWGTNMGYADVNQYLSLIHQTDMAVEKLITYFAQVDEPVVICFFGDHQPSLNTTFYRRLNGKGMSGLTTDELQEFFAVPFFIWTNYDSESAYVERTGLNFLSTLLLERAGIDLPPYHQFLADLMEVIPAMNARAFYSREKGRFVHYGDGSREENVWLEKYRILQYNGLFDDKNRNTLFFRNYKN